MMRRTTIAAALLLATTSGAGAQTPPAATLLASPFADHAVLQRDRPVAIWGKATPGARITVRLGQTIARARAGGDGAWRVMLPARPAGGPYRLTAAASDGATQQIDDVLVGDVILCSGQSNMEWAVRQSLDADGQIARAADDGLRLLKIDHQHGAAPFPALARKIGWAAAAPDTVPDFSSACYHMGRELRKTQKVPLGLIDATWGGSTIESWMSAAALRAFGGYDAELALVAQRERDPAAAGLAWTARWEDWWRQVTGGSQGEPWRDPASAAWKPVPGTAHWQRWGDRALENYNASLWFRSGVTLTPAQAAQPATLLLGPIDEIDHSWLNGRAIGMTEERGRPRAYPVPAGVLKAGANSIVVNVFDGYAGGGLTGPLAERVLQLADGTRVPIDSAWTYRRPPGAAEWPPRAPWSALSGFATIGNGMIAPLAPYTLRGVAWYQGESNVHEATIYDRLLAAWMADWRGRFAQADLPFLIVQLSSFGSPAENVPSDEGWGRQRDAQRKAAAADRHAALVVSYDLGERTDIHPANKLTLGLRLARAAQAEFYGAAVTPSGPLPLRATRAGDTIRVRFGDAGRGLVTYSAHTAIGFELCDAAARCRFADGRVVGQDGVVLPVEAGTTPATVRFCWANGPVCNLYDRDGMPVPTFELPVTAG